MNRLWLGVLLGVTVGVVDVLLMVPLQFPDRTATPTRSADDRIRRVGRFGSSSTR